MNIEWAQTFLEIVKYGSINLAAEAMYLSQSTVSTRLNLLEEELGYKLIYRQKGQRTLALTNEGEAFLPLARRLAEIQEEAHGIRQRHTMRLRIAAVDSINRSFLNHVYRRLLSQYPGVQLSLYITTRHSEEIYDLVERHDIDLGLSTIELNRKNVKTSPLFCQRFYAARQCDNPTGLLQIHPYELDPQKEVILHHETPFYRWHDYWWGGRAALQIDSFSLLSDFLAMKDYWAMITLSTIRDLPSADRIQIYQVIESPPERTCYLLEAADQTRREKYQLFYRTMYEVLKDDGFMKERGFLPV